MFELFKTSEKLMFPQTMPVVKSIRNLLNSALLFTCVHFTSPSGVNAQESEDPVLPDVMQVYADMLETQCQYDFIGNLNSNITNTGLGTIDFEDYARPALLPNLGGGFRFISEDGDCYSTESLT